MLNRNRRRQQCLPIGIAARAAISCIFDHPENAYDIIDFRTLLACPRLLVMPRLWLSFLLACPSLSDSKVVEYEPSPQGYSNPVSRSQQPSRQQPDKSAFYDADVQSARAPQAVYLLIPSGEHRSLTYLEEVLGKYIIVERSPPAYKQNIDRAPHYLYRSQRGAWAITRLEACQIAVQCDLKENKLRFFSSVRQVART